VKSSDLSKRPELHVILFREKSRVKYAQILRSGARRYLHSGNFPALPGSKAPATRGVTIC